MPRTRDLVIFVMTTDDRQTKPIALPLAHVRRVKTGRIMYAATHTVVGPSPVQTTMSFNFNIHSILVDYCELCLQVRAAIHVKSKDEIGGWRICTRKIQYHGNTPSLLPIYPTLM